MAPKLSSDVLREGIIFGINLRLKDIDQIIYDIKYFVKRTCNFVTIKFKMFLH